MSRFTKTFAAIALAIGIPLLLTLSGCSKAKDPWKEVEGGQTKVLVTFPPLYCFTTAVAGKDAKVQTLLSATGPHEHQPSSADAHLAAGADLFLANGLTLDDFVAKVANTSANKKIKVVKIADEALPDAKRLPMAGHAHDDEHEHGKGEGEKHDHDHGEWDPHAWLGIEQAILMVAKIRDTLKDADPANAANYDKRTADYTKKLEELQAYGKDKLKDKKDRKLIAMHESLGYFCKSFDLQLVASIMPRPGVEADNAKLAELAKACEKNGVRVIAVEPQYSEERAKVLKKNLENIGQPMTIILIDPLETAPRDELGPDYYLKQMRKNIDNLAEKLP